MPIVVYLIKQYGLGGLGLVLIGAAFYPPAASNRQGLIVAGTVCIVLWVLLAASLGLL
ncbi:MAG: hypothetical protein AB7H96_17130 [Vicinamibacterales bacterium]